MNIAVFTDWRFARLACPTGVSKHLVHMLSTLARQPGHSLSRLATRDQLASPPNVPPMPTRRIPLCWKAADALWTSTGRPVADRWCGQADWVYCPKNDFIPMRRLPVAFTVHGAPELDPSFPQSRNVRARLERCRRRAAYQRALAQATRVLTVSHFLKHQLIEWFSTPPERIVVVGNGVEPEYFAASAGTAADADPPSVMFVGGMNALDGGDRVVAAARVFQRELPGWEILVAGAQHEVGLLAKAREQPNISLLGYLAAPELAARLRSARALLFPTRYETFGLAAAEALAVGTPVLAARTAAVPEVLGEAALYADNPDDPREWAALVKALEDSPGLRGRLVRSGQARAATYTWEDTATRMLGALTM